MRRMPRDWGSILDGGQGARGLFEGGVSRGVPATGGFHAQGLWLWEWPLSWPISTAPSHLEEKEPLGPPSLAAGELESLPRRDPPTLREVETSRVT